MNTTTAISDPPPRPGESMGPSKEFWREAEEPCQCYWSHTDYGCPHRYITQGDIDAVMAMAGVDYEPPQ